MNAGWRQEGKYVSQTIRALLGLDSPVPKTMTSYSLAISSMLGRVKRAGFSERLWSVKVGERYQAD